MFSGLWFLTVECDAIAPVDLVVCIYEILRWGCDWRVLDELKLIAVKSFGKDLKVFRLNYSYGFLNSMFFPLRKL